MLKTGKGQGREDWMTFMFNIFRITAKTMQSLLSTCFPLRNSPLMYPIWSFIQSINMPSVSNTDYKSSTVLKIGKLALVTFKHLKQASQEFLTPSNSPRQSCKTNKRVETSQEGTRPSAQLCKFKLSERQQRTKRISSTSTEFSWTSS